MNEVSETGMVTELVKIRHPLGDLRPSSYRLLIPKSREPVGNWSITMEWCLGGDRTQYG